jgi:hypothetical protein
MLISLGEGLESEQGRATVHEADHLDRLGG